MRSAEYFLYFHRERRVIGTWGRRIRVNPGIAAQKIFGFQAMGHNQHGTIHVQGMHGKYKPPENLAGFGLNNNDFRDDGHEVVETNRFVLKANGIESKWRNAVSQIIPPFGRF